MSDNGCGFPAPGLHSFLFEPIADFGWFYFNKVMLLALLTTIVICVSSSLRSAARRSCPGRCR